MARNCQAHECERQILLDRIANLRAALTKIYTRTIHTESREIADDALKDDMLK